MKEFPIADCRLPIADCRLTIDRTSRSEKGIEMNKDDLKARTKQFSLRVLRLVDALPNSKSGNAIGGQLVRSGTSVGSNYRAACRGRSRAEFIAKIGVVEEEADESAFWLELITDHKLLKDAQVKPLWIEAGELTAIMAASRISASRNARPLRSRRVLFAQSAIGNRQSAI
jgi:four helix bundle protein